VTANGAKALSGNFQAEIALARDWLWLGNDPSKIVASWMSLKAFYLRLREYLEPNEALQRLTASSIPIKKRHVYSGEETIISSVGEEVDLSVGRDTITGADYLEIIDYTAEHRHPSLSDDPAEFHVPVVDAARALERLAAAAAPSQEQAAAPAPTPPNEEPKRRLRRWSAKYEWDVIYAEIASRCIDPKTRRVLVPKNESKLADNMLQWCEDTNKAQPAPSEMRDAVHAICQALRKI
jgi:hypothetical protein